MICEGHPYLLKTYLNLTSLHKHSITVAPPKECPIIAILHKSMEFWNGGKLIVISTPQIMIEHFSILTNLNEFKLIVIFTSIVDKSKSHCKTFSTDFPELMSKRISKALMHSSALCFTWNIKEIWFVCLEHRQFLQLFPGMIYKKVIVRSLTLIT